MSGGNIIGEASRIDSMTLAGPDGMLMEIHVEPMLEPPVAGFLKLTRTSDTGARSGPIFVSIASITHMERERWNDSFTRVWLATDCHIRVAETPELILEALA